MARLFLICMMGVMLGGCVLPKAFDRPGMAPDAKQALFARDYAECEDEAYVAWGAAWYKRTGAMVSMPRPVPPDSIAGMFIDDERVKCLEARGWVRVDVPPVEIKPKTMDEGKL